MSCGPRAPRASGRDHSLVEAARAREKFAVPGKNSVGLAENGATMICFRRLNVPFAIG